MRARHRVVLLMTAVCVLLASALAMTSAADGPTTKAAAPEAPAKPDQPSKPAPESVPEPEAAPLPEKFYIKDMVTPEYPEEARDAGVEAIVFIELFLDDEHEISMTRLKTVLVGRPPLEVIRIDESGQIVEPVEEEGMEVYHQAFVDAAMEAVRQWSLGIEPQNATFENPAAVVPIQFRLEGDAKAPEEARL